MAGNIRVTSIHEKKRTERTQNPNVLDAIAPEWGLDAADWIADQEPGGWTTISLILGILVTLLGGVLLFGGGYASIQGIRGPLADLGLKIQVDTFPSFPWWLIPIGNTFVQVFTKWLRGLRGIWRTSMTYDGATSAIFIAWALALWVDTSLASDQATVLWWTIALPTANIIGIGLLASVFGLFTAVFAEQCFLGGLCMLRVALERRSEEN